MSEQREIPSIETDRLFLTIPSPDAAPRMLAFASENREHLARWQPPEPPNLFTEEFWRDFLSSSHKEFVEGRGMRLVIFLKSDPSGRVIGECNFSNIVRGPFQACFLGYKIDHREEGKGYMKEALAAAIKYAFENLRLHRLMANYMPINERSGGLLRRLGFTVEGYARDYLLIENQWRDHVLTSLTNHELKPEDLQR